MRDDLLRDNNKEIIEKKIDDIKGTTLVTVEKMQKPWRIILRYSRSIDHSWLPNAVSFYYLIPEQPWDDFFTLNLYFFCFGSLSLSPSSAAGGTGAPKCWRNKTTPAYKVRDEESHTKRTTKTTFPGVAHDCVMTTMVVNFRCNEDQFQTFRFRAVQKVEETGEIFLPSLSVSLSARLRPKRSLTCAILDGLTVHITCYFKNFFIPCCLMTVQLFFCFFSSLSFTIGRNRRTFLCFGRKATEPSSSVPPAHLVVHHRWRIARLVELLLEAKRRRKLTFFFSLNWFLSSFHSTTTTTIR